MRKKSPIYFRVDTSANMGMGHLIRSISIAQMLEMTYEISFISQSFPEAIVQEYKNEFSFQIAEDDKSFLDLISSESIVVLDGYGFDEDLQKAVRALSCVVVCINDIPGQRYYADLILNHCPGITPSDFNAEIYTQFCLGPKFTLLRQAFLRQSGEQFKSKSESILICFGGADYNNLTLRAVSVVLESGRFKRVIVVTGVAYTHSKSLIPVLNEYKLVEYVQCANEEQMCNLLAEVDLAIVPSSGVLLEALSLSCKVISGICVDNQKHLYTRYKALGAFIDALDFSEESLRQAVEKSCDYEGSGINFIDRKSGRRIQREFSRLQLMTKIIIRDADISDLETTFRWATDPKIRQYAFGAKAISKNDHTAWFLSKIIDQSCFYFILVLEGKALGSIRFDISEEMALISYLIDSEHHCKGYGQILLKKGLEAFEQGIRKRGMQVNEIVAIVKRENLPSLKVLKKFGFMEIEEQEYYIFKRKL